MEKELMPTKHRWHRWQLTFRGGIFESGQERILEGSPTECVFRPQILLAPANVSPELSLLGVTVCGEEQLPTLPDGLGIPLVTFAASEPPASHSVKWKICPRDQKIALRVRNTGKETVELKDLIVIGEGFKENV